LAVGNNEGVDKMPAPVYSNIVNVRVSAAELILDFGLIVPDSPGPVTPPIAFDPSARIIMSTQGIRKFAEMLSVAADNYEMQKKQLEQQDNPTVVSAPIHKTAKQG
jgi:hypothetical protein